MATYKNELSNLSYTNKDFSTIYPELLDIVKKLSYKWDPTISDESDPGVVLLKLNALMTDKLNYNIDKNILELFPSSVTQYQNAREIFDQCGYTMRYYNSAVTSVAFTLKRLPTPEELGVSEINEDDSMIVIPRFTMLSTPDNKLIYTITDDVKLSYNTDDAPVLAIEGRVQDYTINGSNLITVNMLDDKNRLYLSGTDIAENGIFITNQGKDNYNEWEAVDNLVLQDLGTHCYKFGLTRDGTKCYIEFPTDINDIIGNGLNIKYIRTKGKLGALYKKSLTNFYTDTSAKLQSISAASSTAPTESFTISTEHVHFTNPLSSWGGKDPETIEEANKNYQKVKTTFDTLVSLRDYNNYLYTSEMVSNGFVCDRLNDPQSSYKIVTLQDGVETSTTKVNKSDVAVYQLDSNDSYKKLEGTAAPNNYYYYDTETGVYTPITKADELTAFDLRIYAFNYVPNVTSEDAFNKTFNVMEQIESRAGAYGLQEQWDYLTDHKCIQHDFKAPIPKKPFIFKNKYPINATIIPTQKLDTLGKTEVRNSVKLALFALLNSRECDWGVAPDYATVYETILTADSRIRAVLLSDFTYETWAVYLTPDSTVKEVRIDSGVTTPPTDTTDATVYTDIREEIKNRSYLTGVTPLYNKVSNFSYNVNQQGGQEIHNVKTFATSTEIPFVLTDETNINCTVRDNEQLTFTAPSVIKDREYTNYVKFVCNFNCSSEELYELKDGEYIIFFWKTDDKESTKYTYNLYTSETTKDGVPVKYIQADRSITENDSDTDNVPQKLKDFIARAINNKQWTGSVIDSDCNLTYIPALIGSDYVVEPPSVIKSMKVNQIKLGTTDTQYMIWFVNDSLGTLLTAEAKEYTLGPNEYVLYTNSQRTTLHAAGEGTKIKRSSDKTSAISKSFGITLDQIESIGLDAITDDLWYKINDTDGLTLEEQEFVSLGSGTTVYINTGDSNIDEFVVGEGDDDSDTIKAKFDGLYLNSSTEPLNLSNCSISYQISGQEDTTQLTKRSNELAWTASATLNLNLENQKAQTLSSGQSVTLKYSTTVDGNETTIEERIDGSDEDVYIQASSDLLYTQRTTSDQFVKEYTGKETLVFYEYRLSSNSNSIIDSDGYLVELDATTTTTTISCHLPVGCYILPINITTTNLDTFDITTGEGDSATSLQNLFTHDGVNGDQNPTAYGYHWYILTFADADPKTITITAELKSGSTDTKLIQLLPPVKYANNTTGDKTKDLQGVCNKLATKYDPQLTFNYTAEFDPETQIEEPLDSYSFFNPNHVMNKYTIAQAIFTTNSEENIKVDDRVR